VANNWGTAGSEVLTLMNMKCSISIDVRMCNVYKFPSVLSVINFYQTARHQILNVPYVMKLTVVRMVF
jgi:hypothetical protein